MCKIVLAYMRTCALICKQPNEMSTSKHTAPEVTSGPDNSPVVLALRMPGPVKWGLREIAARRQTTMGRLAIAVLEDFVAREKGAAA